MEWDLGPLGLLTLLAMALAFGVLAQLMAGRGMTWLWAKGAAVYFGAGILTSEAWFGWADEQELQPNIDGLSFDEVLLFATLTAIVAIVLARRVARRNAHGRPRHT